MSVDFFEMTSCELKEHIKKQKENFGEKLLIPAHHYEHSDVVELADFVGDSYKLAVECSANKRPDAEFIVFCGVRFMAEGARILANSGQKVLSPNLNAGCPMADMINANQAEEFYQAIQGKTEKEVIPIVYMNSYADIKAFCGERGGSVCTSSNAAKIVRSYLEQEKAVFFAPDYNLGINTAHQLGIPDDEIVKVKRNMDLETKGDISKAKLFLWDGYCHVHKVFTVEDCTALREKYPSINIIVHPECNEAVVKAADISGSTQQILNAVKDAPKDSVWGIGTEYNFVARLAENYPDKNIMPLRKSVCTNMQKITLELLADSLRSINNFKEGNDKLKYEVTVSDHYKENSKKALQKMIDIVEAK